MLTYGLDSANAALYSTSSYVPKWTGTAANAAVTNTGSQTAFVTGTGTGSQSSSATGDARTNGAADLITNASNMLAAVAGVVIAVL